MENSLIKNYGSRRKAKGTIYFGAPAFAFQFKKKKKIEEGVDEKSFSEETAVVF